MEPVLLLDADHTPVRAIAWQRAVELVLGGRVSVVVARDDAAVRSERLTLPWPSVVALVRWTPVRPVPTPHRRNVLARDGHACVYCGATAAELAHRPPHERLTLDHVVPRARAAGGKVVVPWCSAPVPVSSWQNLVAACGRCNGRKGDRTPEEAGMRLPRPPHRPTHRELLAATASRGVPEAWRPWLPAAA